MISTLPKELAKTLYCLFAFFFFPFPNPSDWQALTCCEPPTLLSKCSKRKDSSIIIPGTSCTRSAFEAVFLSFGEIWLAFLNRLVSNPVFFVLLSAKCTVFTTGWQKKVQKCYELLVWGKQMPAESIRKNTHSPFSHTGLYTKASN